MNSLAHTVKVSTCITNESCYVPRTRELGRARTSTIRTRVSMRITQRPVWSHVGADFESHSAIHIDVQSKTVLGSVEKENTSGVQKGTETPESVKVHSLRYTIESQGSSIYFVIQICHIYTKLRIQVFSV